MAIKFFNIRSGEVRVAETEPHISAMWASSDHSPNITQGQDFGWRLAPEVVVKMKQIKQDFNVLQQIASRLLKNVDEIGEPDILFYISAQYGANDAPVASDSDYETDYDEEVRRLSREAEKEQQAHVDRDVDQVPDRDPEPTTPAPTTPPVADTVEPPAVEPPSGPAPTNQTKPEKPQKPAK